MRLVDFTSYTEVRAALGVSDDELEDETLALPMYADALQGELQDIAAALVTAFITVSAKSQGSRTEAEQWFFQCTRLFSTYAVAKQLGSALPLFSPKDILDGKATASRFADSPYKVVLSKIDKEYDRMMTRLKSAYAAVASTTVTVTARPYLRGVVPGSDPVTGS